MYHAQSKHATNKTFVVKTGISHIVKRLKLVCVFAIGAVQIHDVTGEAFAWSELAFVHFYLILDGVPKYSITQSLHLYNPFKLDAEITNGAGYIRRSGALNILFNYCIHFHGE